MKILILLFSLLLCLQPVTGVCSSVAETKMLAKIDVSVENLLAGAASENLLNNQVNEIFSSLKKSLGQQLASGKVSALLYQKADQEFWIFDIHSPLVPKLRPFVPKSEKTSTTQEIELTSWTAGKLLLRKIEKERYLLLPSMDVSIIQPELMTNRVTVKNDIQITVYKPEWLEKFQYLE
jgi:hypothetical protein